MYRDHIKGLGIFACAVIVFLIMKDMIADANAYIDGSRAAEISKCQEAGRSYGDCFNVINQRERIKFAD